MTLYLKFPRAAAPLAAALFAFSTAPATAQDATSRAVVQPLPSPEVQRLNRALLELARSPRRIAPLLEAADASLAVGDLDAAIGFYGRAADLEPNNPEVKLGLARVYLQSGRPVDAIPLLNEALSSGAPARDVLPEQALAFDLVGDQASAQTVYARAIELSPQDDEARRRLAISHAISGNEAGFQETLAPLLEARDVAAFRARAFGLAIMGQQERAEGIVNQVMPRDLATRINPYLAYMPRLTPAQQAAAANLGLFPRAADIGREDPRIARFAREGAAGSKLEPAGEPFGAVTTETAPQTELETVSKAVVQSQPEAQPQTPQPQTPQPETSQPETSQPETSQPEPPEASAAALPQIATSQAPEPASVDDAFADLSGAELPVAAGSSDAVDIAAIDVPREAPPEPQPAEPEHPRRIWVQLATGRDVEALGFDWRRFQRKAPDLLSGFEPHVTPWGQANRLLAGPVESREEARNLINALAEIGIETFSYISPEGTEIQRLK